MRPRPPTSPAALFKSGIVATTTPAGVSALADSPLRCGYYNRSYC